MLEVKTFMTKQQIIELAKRPQGFSVTRASSDSLVLMAEELLKSDQVTVSKILGDGGVILKA